MSITALVSSVFASINYVVDVRISGYSNKNRNILIYSILLQSLNMFIKIKSDDTKSKETKTKNKQVKLYQTQKLCIVKETTE